MIYLLCILENVFICNFEVCTMRAPSDRI